MRSFVVSVPPRGLGRPTSSMQLTMWGLGLRPKSSTQSGGAPKARRSRGARGGAPENFIRFLHVKVLEIYTNWEWYYLRFVRFSAIYLADSGKFQIHMINSLVSLHWAEICRLDNRLSQTTPCRHCSWCTCQRGKLGRVPQKRPPGCAQESSARIFPYLTPKGINSQAQSLNK